MALELNECQVLFECGHGRYWYLRDRVLPQVYHTYPPKVNSVNPCPSIQLANLSTDDEVANAIVGRDNLGILGDYLEFVQTHLQGRLIDASGALMNFLFSQINSYYLCYPWLFVKNI